MNKALNDQLSYDPVDDFTPICEIANAPNVFVVNANFGINSLKEFVAFARSQPKGVHYSSPGLGTTPQLSCELLRVRANIPMEHVPYNSGPQAAQALLTNLVQLFCSAIPLCNRTSMPERLSRWPLPARHGGAAYPTCPRCRRLASTTLCSTLW